MDEFIDDYFTAIERGLQQNLQIGSIEDPITCLASDDYNGLIRVRVILWDVAPISTSMRPSVLIGVAGRG